MKSTSASKMSDSAFWSIECAMNSGVMLMNGAAGEVRVRTSAKFGSSRLNVESAATREPSGA